MQNLHRTQIYLTDTQYAYLRHQAEIKNHSMAEVVRNLIDERLKPEANYENNRLFTIGNDNFKMGRPDGSVQHDKYIYQRSEDK